MARKSSVPPSFENVHQMPGMQGARILQQPTQQDLRTGHRTIFLACDGGLFAVLDENDICSGYQLVIIDKGENHRYDFPFGQELKDMWLQELADMPDVGKKAEEEKKQ